MARCKIIAQTTAAKMADYDHLVIWAPKPKKKSSLLEDVPKQYSKLIGKYLSSRAREWKDMSPLSFDLSPKLRCTYITVDTDKPMFELLCLARKASAAYSRAKKVLADFSAIEDQPRLADAVIAAHYAAHEYERPAVKSKKTARTKIQLSLRCLADQTLKSNIRKSELLAESTNLMRELFETPTNHLDCKQLRERAKQEAKAVGARFEFIDRKKLKAMGAEAFLAVARGSDHEDSGIVKLSHGDKSSGLPHLVLVGKGVVYDTGGTNLKPAQYMFGMHGDMGGSALALAVFKALITTRAPVRVSCYLAISDNAIDAKSYRPNEVVKTIKGTTIETVHTDAEGRMLLVDTLSIAADQDYDMLMDFATLTGSCVAAIGTTYSGVFSNREELYPELIAAGKSSGERLWPFPMDDDFCEPLKSKIADLKQCLLRGGVDHIEAAQLLKQFVRKDRPWVHIDLSAAENDGGLAHVPDKITGFGVRVTVEFINRTLLAK